MTTRRSFLKIAGSGIIVLFTVDVSDVIARRTFQVRGYPTDLNAYLRIGEDGRVRLFTGKIEMGQGVYTSLAQMLADELDVPLHDIEPVMGDTALCPWDMGTFGSMTTRFFGPALRRAAAEARAVLGGLASERLGVPVERLATADGFVYDRSNPDVRVAYGALARGRRIERVADGTAPLKERSERRQVGTPEPRLDGRLKVTGRAVYAADIRLDGMLHAALLRPPAHGARLRSVDTRGAEAVEGTRIVRDGDMVACLHARPDLARRARDALRAEWSAPPEGPDHESIFEHLRANAPRPRVVAEAGDPAAGRTAAAKVFRSTYHAAYVAHAPMEPHAAVARMDGEGATVWASTQTPFPLQREVSEVLGCAPDLVRVITPFVGGGFGGKSANQQAVEAVRIARLVGVPVQVAWTREEEFFYDTFRPATIVDVTSGLDDDGRVVLWSYENFHGGDRGARPVYDLANRRIVVRGGWGDRSGRYHPFAVGPWRGPGANVNHFAIESQMDLMAAAAGVDPVSFRLAHLTDERMKRVVRAAADAFGHDWRPAPGGDGVGVALGADAGTYVASMARVRVDPDSGAVRVLRIVCAQDMGEIINPEGARMQMEGGLIQGLGYALSEEIHFRSGAIADGNFDTYRIPRFSWVPDVEAVLVPNPDLPPQGGGEPSVTTVGAVLANAIHDATGARLFTLPMTPERIRAALPAAESAGA